MLRRVAPVVLASVAGSSIMAAAAGVMGGALLLGVVASSTPAQAAPISPPDAPGRYNVGTTTFTATLSGGRVARVQVFYPTLAARDCPSHYTILPPPGPDTYRLDSPLCAVAGGTAAEGPFPLIVYDHGGPVAGADFQRVFQLPLHELLASHGFVLAVALHSPNAVNRALDLPLVIDTMLARSATPGDLLEGAIDASRVGASGFSAGGASVLSAAGGWTAEGIQPDARIKAMALYEPSRSNTLSDVSTISVPYLIMGGTQFRNSGLLPEIFEATSDALPRIHVQSPNAVHFNYATSLCALTDQAREQALAAAPLLPDPLTTLNTASSAAIAAFTNWNMGELQFTANGHGFGGARNICNRVGIDSVLPLDANADGLTDSPPFFATDAFTLAPAIPGEVMVPVVQLYTVAFWKSFLAGDGRYKRYLSPGYARQSALGVAVDVRERSD